MMIATQDLHAEIESSSADLLEDFAVSAPGASAAAAPAVLASFGTKADTLAALQPLVCELCPSTPQACSTRST